MRRSDYQTLLNRGRKAGLRTSELYGALNGRRPLAYEVGQSGRDGNGFRVCYDAHGNHTYQPDHRGEGT